LEYLKSKELVPKNWNIIEGRREKTLQEKLIYIYDCIMRDEYMEMFYEIVKKEHLPEYYDVIK